MDSTTNQPPEKPMLSSIFGVAARGGFMPYGQGQPEGIPSRFYLHRDSPLIAPTSAIDLILQGEKRPIENRPPLTADIAQLKLNGLIAMPKKVMETSFLSDRSQPLSAWPASSQVMAVKGLPHSAYVPKIVKKPGLTEEKIVRWMQATYEETGEWPTEKSVGVWDKDPETGKRFMIKDENWVALDAACRKGSRGLPGLGSLALLKDKHGLNNDLTEELLVEMIIATHEVTGQWPTEKSKMVYYKNKDTGECIHMKSENWNALNLACKRKGRGLSHEIGSLAELKAKHGLYDSPRRVRLGSGRVGGV